MEIDEDSLEYVCRLGAQAAENFLASKSSVRGGFPSELAGMTYVNVKMMLKPHTENFTTPHLEHGRLIRVFVDMMTYH